MNKDTKELINRRRRQILVHSCLYYRMNQPVITDEKFDRWAYELVELQNDHPEIAKECVFHESFKGFDGSTGFDLPLGNYKVRTWATRLLNNSYVKEYINKIRSG